MEQVVAHLKKRKRTGSRFSIAVVAEGAFPKGGEKFYEKDPDEGSPGRLGGIGHWVSERIGQLAGVETRTVVLGHTQRGGTPTTYDRILATRFGVEAVNHIALGHYGQMVCLKGNAIVAKEIVQAIKEIKHVDPDGQLVRTAEALGITTGRPL
jgi:6-phosphofructokinase 1